MLGKCCRCCSNNCNRYMDKYDITMRQLIELKNNGAVLVDIRSPQEYKEGHIDGAIVIPDYEIRKTIDGIIPNKNQLIVVYCGTGIRSKNVQRFLKQKGYVNVYNLYKGTENY